jgi:hypothetical protein
MLTHPNVHRISAASDHVGRERIVCTPCVAIHTEDSQVPRFVDRAKALRVAECHEVSVSAVAPPLIYIQAQPDAAASHSRIDINAVLRLQAESAFSDGRIAAHRVYQLNWSCSDPQWIFHSQAFRDAASNGSFSVRIVAFPRQLQTKMADLLVAHGIAASPTNFTHELFVTAQPSVSSLFFFGLAPRRQAAIVHTRSVLGPTTRAEAPCRAFFKLQESLLHYVNLAHGQHVLDVGASPGGWTDCLLRHGARVVAVDPGELTIPLVGRTVVHIPSLLEDAFESLSKMERFAMAVCDINVRVPTMAALMVRVAPLLLPGARIVFTLKLGKKPTPPAVEAAYTNAQQALSPAFADFQLVWLHANTQNERTLFAVKRP